MKRLILLCLAAAAACSEPSPHIEQGSSDVQVRLPPASPDSMHVDPSLSAQVIAPPALSVSLAVAFEPGDAVSASEIRQAVVTVSLLGASGRSGAVEFVAPSGAVSDRRTVALSGNPFERQVLTVALPIAGTLIDSSSMTGGWTVGFEQDDGVHAGGAAFEVAP